MKKSIGVSSNLFPMPVLMIATYDEYEKVNVMNMAWGGICARNMVALNISEGHKTTKNMRLHGAFTLSVANVETMNASDYFGIVSGNDVEDKFERTGMHAVKSTRVDAPIVEEYPLTLECKVVEFQDTVYGLRVLGEIVNTLVDESVLAQDGTVDTSKLNALIFDTFQHGYYAVGEKVGQAWENGTEFMYKDQ